MISSNTKLLENPNLANSLFHLLFIVLISFVGDHYLFGFPSFFIVFISYIIGTILFQKSFSIRPILAVILLCFILSINILRELYVGNWTGYALAYLQVSLTIGVYYAALSKLEKSQIHISPIISLTLSIFYLLAVFFITYDHFFGDIRRARFLFGPNIMYRLYAVLGIFTYFLIFYTNCKWKFLLKVAIIAITLAGCISTGSRGGLIIFVFFLSAVIFIEFFHRRRVSVLWLLIASVGVTILMVTSYMLASTIGIRSAYFNLANNSEAQRVAFVEKAVAHLMNSNFIDWMVGSGSANGPFQFYPHNVFIETLVWGGIIPFALAIFSAAWLVNAFVTGSTARRFYSSIGIIILIGSQFSGSLLDNYAFISIAIAGLAFDIGRKKHPADNLWRKL